MNQNWVMPVMTILVKYELISGLISCQYHEEHLKFDRRLAITANGAAQRIQLPNTLDVRFSALSRFPRLPC